MGNIEILQIIMDDCEADVHQFENAPFNGKTVGSLHGILEAKIQALARILKETLEAMEKK